MKSSYYILIIIVTFLGVTTQAQAQTTSEELIGTWTFDYDTSSANMTAASKSIIDRMNENQKQNLQALYKNRTITFFKNGKYQQKLSNGKTINRNWTLEGNILVISNTTRNNANSSYTLEILTDSTLVLKPKDKGQAKALISQWYYTKN